MLDVIYGDDSFVAVNKPANLAAIPGRGESGSVLEQLATQLNLPCRGSADPRVRVVHRIDKDTTGVLLFAKNIEAQRHVSHQFQNNTVHKEYLALIVGKLAEDAGVIDQPIAPHPEQKERMAVNRHGRPAVTEWKVERRLRRFTLVRVFPRTGKTHQIRVHFAHIGHPLAIDPLYGSDQPIYLSQYKRGYRPTRGEEERPMISRLTLHAERLSLQKPDGMTLTIEAPPPKDFRAVVNQLGKL